MQKKCLEVEEETPKSITIGQPSKIIGFPLYNYKELKLSKQN